jgi:hypothetical protein
VQELEQLRAENADMAALVAQLQVRKAFSFTLIRSGASPLLT